MLYYEIMINDDSKLNGKKRSGLKPLFLTQPYMSSSLVKGSFRKITMLPKYVDESEWIASNTQDFINYISMFYGTIGEYCNVNNCAIMGAGQNNDYLWVDNQKKCVKIPAPQYVDYVLSWVQTVLRDESIFPTKSGSFFPKNFSMTIRTIYKQLFRVLAHIYHSHFEIVVTLAEESHLNTLFAHFVCFSREFDLIDRKEYLPMQELIDFYELPEQLENTNKTSSTDAIQYV